MKTRAAVLHKPRQLKVEEVELDPPRRHEVRVKISAVGVCASDHHRYTGDAPHPLPCVLGHEGAGVVEEAGEGVEGLKPGDPVVLTVLPTCGTCPRCTQGEPYHCPRGWQTIASGKLLDNTRRLKRAGGGILNHFLGQSSMAEHAVVHERTAVKILPDVPMEKAALLGCGATTGFGAVFHAPGFKPGCTVAIFGCGGVGTSGLLAAKAGGASTIIAVDLQEEKLQQARALGATHTLNPTQGSPVQKILDLTGGGVDVALEFVGNPKVMEHALRSTRMGGATVITGEPKLSDMLQVSPILFYGRIFKGNVVGEVQPPQDIPRYLEMVQRGILPLDKLITRTYPLEQADQAFRDLESGKNVRGVLVPKS